MKKWVLILLFCVGGVILSCERCPEVQNRFFNLTGIIPQQYILQAPEDSYLDRMDIAASDSVEAHQYRFGFEFEKEFLAEQSTRVFTTSLYALDCNHGVDVAAQQVTSIHVVTLNNYNMEYQAGDTLNAIVQYQDGNTGAVVSLQEANENPRSTAFFNYLTFSMDHQFTIPDSGENQYYKQEIQITVQLNNNTNYTEILDPVYLRY